MGQNRPKRKATTMNKLYTGASAANTLASHLSQIGMLQAISYRLKYEKIYYSNMRHFFTVDFRKWISTAIKTRTDRDFRTKMTSEWDKEFAWNMWGWFVQGLEKGLLGDALFEFIEESYWLAVVPTFPEEVLNSEE